ncbi:MAG: hypothetical protein RJA70_3294 [Pseudomonadota bacterium]|jgi:uncharacterized membrane protein YfcA
MVSAPHVILADQLLLIVGFVSAGAAAGFIGGLLGAGGGLVVVPALAFLLPKAGVSEELVMHVAVGTSLATIIATGSSSTWTHHRQGNVDRELTVRLGLGIVLGASSAGLVAGWVPAGVLKVSFVVFMMFASARMLFQLEFKRQFRLPGQRVLFVVGCAIGAIATWLGIGGGALSVPFLSACQVPMRRAIGTSAALGLPIAISGTTGFVVSGLGANNLPRYALGYVYVPAFLVIGLLSVGFAFLGARATAKVPVANLKRVFGLVLLLGALKMGYGLLL